MSIISGITKLSKKNHSLKNIFIKKLSLKNLTPKKIARFILEIGVIVAIVAGISIWQTRNMLETDGSFSIPPINLVTVEGEVQPLYNPERRTLVYFWAPWCSVCAISIGSLDNVNSEELDIVTIAMDFDSIESVEAFVEKHEVTSKVLLGNEQMRNMFKIHGYPSYYLLDEDAQVVAKSFGLNTAIGIKLKDWLSKS